MIQFRCTCGKPLQAKEEYAGMQISCPACQTFLTVPGHGAAIQPASQTAPLPASERTTARAPAPAGMGPPPSRPRPQRDLPQLSGKALAALLLGIGTFIVPVLMAIPAVILALLAFKDVARGAGRVTGKGMAIGGLACALAGNITILPYYWLFETVNEGSARRDSEMNLKQIGLAMHNYHDTYRGLPPAAIRGRDGKALLSWRVAILPFIEQAPLYQQFRLDEPWDSPNNIRLLSQMPKLYQPVRGSAPVNSTFYQVCTGPETPFAEPLLPKGGFPGGFQGGPFPNMRGLTLMQFLDGTSNTILVVEAGEAVPWTKPEEVAVTPGMSLPRLGGMFGRGFNVLMADGSVRWVDRGRVSESTLRIAINPNDGMPLPDF